jgi:hypothetical protein
MASRPYFPYVPRRAAANTTSDFERGMQAGGQIGKLLGGLGGAIQQSRQNQVANQLLNQQYPGTSTSQGNDPDPNPIDASGQPITDPNAVVPDVGLPDITTPGNLQGGVAELQMRQAAAKEDLEMQIKKAQLANALGGNASSWMGQGGGGAGKGGAGKTAKAAPYEPGSIDANTDPSADDFQKVRADFDNVYGKNMYDKFQANFSNLSPDDKGNYPILGKDGAPIATVPGSDAPYWLNRNNAARVQQGLSTIGPLPTGANPTSGKPSGSQENPIPVTNNLQLRALPFGTWIMDPSTGQKKQKQPLAAAQ